MLVNNDSNWSYDIWVPSRNSSKLPTTLGPERRSVDMFSPSTSANNKALLFCSYMADTRCHLSMYRSKLDRILRNVDSIHYDTFLFPTISCINCLVIAYCTQYSVSTVCSQQAIHTVCCRNSIVVALVDYDDDDDTVARFILVVIYLA